MNWDLKSDRPIYIQLVEHLQLAIISGLLPPGSRVPPGARAGGGGSRQPQYDAKGPAGAGAGRPVQTQRTSGRTVTQDTGRIAAVKAEFAGGEVSAFLEKMAAWVCAPAGRRLGRRSRPAGRDGRGGRDAASLSRRSPPAALQ